jgi:hypothetical protein
MRPRSGREGKPVAGLFGAKADRFLKQTLGRPLRRPPTLARAAVAVAAAFALFAVVISVTDVGRSPVPAIRQLTTTSVTPPATSVASPAKPVPSTSTPRPSPQVFVPPASIPDDCSSDAGPALRAWLWSLPRGTPTSPLVVNFPANACYVVNESLYLRGFTNTILNGQGATFRQVVPTVQNIGPLPTTQPYCGSSVDLQSGATVSTIPIIWWFEGGCDITISNMRIIGPDSAGVVGSQDDSGIQLSGVQRVLIDGVDIEDVDGDFITLTGLHEGSDQAGGGVASTPTTDATIRDNTFSRSGRQGITPQYVDRVSITGNSFRGVAATDIDLEADTTGGCACNVDVDHNTFAGLDPYLVAGLTGLSIEHFTFSDNVLTDGAQPKIQLAPDLASSDIVISGNSGTTASTWPWPSIGVAYSVDGDSAGPLDGVQVSGNSFPAPLNGQPFVLAGSQASNVVMSGNVISGGTQSTSFVNQGSPSNQACGNTAGPGLPLGGAC